MIVPVVLKRNLRSGNLARSVRGLEPELACLPECVCTILPPLSWWAHHEHLGTIYELLLFYQAIWTITQALQKEGLEWKWGEGRE